MASLFKEESTMNSEIRRREFIQLVAAGGAFCLTGSELLASGAIANAPRLISPGCRRTKVKVAKIFIGNPKGLWPKPDLDFQAEVAFYQAEFAKLKNQLSDVDFVVDELVTTSEQVDALTSKLQGVDGVLIIHLSLETRPILEKILAAGQPTMVFSAPYSGHEWAGFGVLRKQELGAKMDCLLTSDYSQLAVAIRPFRAIHHLKEAKVLDLTTNMNAEYVGKVKEKFGTEIVQVELQRMLDTYESIDNREAQAEADLWTKRATKVIEPPKEEIFKSLKLALAFQKLLEEEEATAMTVDCYGSMYRKLPAFPCIGFTRLNDLGLGGICESDLRSAITHIIFQGLSGRPSFISDPTVDESKNSIILAHCLGSTKMDGPDGPAAPYKIRTIMERQEGAVTQVSMRRGQKVTQAIIVGTDKMVYFTGDIIDVPNLDRGCRTKITVKVDGSVERLWKNWTAGLHRQTCYGDLTKDLERFSKFKAIELVNEAA